MRQRRKVLDKLLVKSAQWKDATRTSVQFQWWKAHIVEGRQVAERVVLAEQHHHRWIKGRVVRMWSSYTMAMQVNCPLLDALLYATVNEHQ
jgi:hypothetical protein